MSPHDSVTSTRCCKCTTGNNGTSCQIFRFATSHQMLGVVSRCNQLITGKFLRQLPANARILLVNWALGDFAAAFALLLILPLAVRLALDSGISCDENKQLDYGNLVLAWYKGKFTDQSSFTYFDLHLYGGLFDLPAQLLLYPQPFPWGPYETRHVFSALLAVFGIVAVWMTQTESPVPVRACLQA